MPQVTLPKYWLHPEGWFPGTVTKIEDVGGNFGPQIRWHFETPELQADEDGTPICDDNGEQLHGRLSDFTGLSASANSKKQSKLGKLLLALGVKLPETQEEAEAMNDDWFLRLLGKKAMIKVNQKTMDDGRIFANILEYKPVAAAKPAPVVKPATPAAAKPVPAVQPAAEPPEGCPDPDYRHDAVQGDEDYDPFHKDTCPLLSEAA